MTNPSFSPQTIPGNDTARVWQVGATGAGKYVDALRRRHPQATPRELLHVINQQYKLAMSASGTGVGLATIRTARIPSLIALSAAHIGVGGLITTFYLLAVTNLYGLEPDQVPPLLKEVVPQDGVLEQQFQRSWWRSATAFLPVSQVKFMDGVARRSLSKAARKGTVSPSARMLPGGIGAGVGVAGGRILAHRVITATQDSLGAPPTSFLLT